MTTVAPAATRITIPPVPSVNDVPRGTQLRIPRSVQLQLARSLTFGVIGEDSQLYPSSKWQTEKQGQYGNRLEEISKSKQDFLITSLDTRKHNPQTKHLFHIKRINTKPVCGVQAWETEKSPRTVENELRSVYKVSYQGDTTREQTHRYIHKLQPSKPIEAIVPVNMTGSKVDIRAEMMLPVCDSTAMPSAHNPHRYLLRKRKVPPPFKSSGVVYPNLEKPRMTSYINGGTPTGDLPFETEKQKEPCSVDEYPDRISVSSLSGLSFSRRKYIQPPTGHILGSHDPVRPESPKCVSSLAGKRFTRRRLLQPPLPEIEIGFDGSVPQTNSTRSDDKYFPFMKAKTII